jgi:hypothetical protein
VLTFRRVILHLSVWLCVFFLWLFATRQFHPRLSIAISATATLVSASALAIYLDRLLLLPKFARRRLWWQYAASLAAVVIALDLIAVALIQLIYDWLWRPDPLRFGFWFNLASDGFIIALHLIVVKIVQSLKSKVQGQDDGS